MLKARILYIEDDAGLARLTQRKLDRAGYSIDIVHDGDEGLTKLHTDHYDVILADLHLPTVDGLEIVKKIAAEIHAPPLIMISGTTNPSLAVEAMKLGARDFLLKESDQAYLDLLPTIIDRVLQQQHLLLAKNKAEQELQLLQTVVAQISDIVVIAETVPSNPFDAKIVFVNQAFERLTDYSISDALGQPLGFLLQTETNQEVLKQIQQALADNHPLRTELLNLNKENYRQWLELDVSPILDQKNHCTHYVAVIRDVSQRKRMEDALFREKERAEVTLHSIGDAVITTDGVGIVDYLNPAAEQLTGWSLLEACGSPLSTVFQVIDEQHRQPVTDLVNDCLNNKKNEKNTSNTPSIAIPEHYFLLNRNGQEYAVKISITSLGDRLGVVLAFQDVTEERRMTREITYNATHDALTSLVNRREFEHRLERVLEDVRRQQAMHALCFMDLDHFKIVNDTCGHTAGDELLKQVSELLQQNIRKRDTLARLGGDEFALLMEHCPLEQAERVANTLKTTLEEFRFSWGNHAFSIGISIGLVPITADSGNLSEVIKQADTACYVAKDNGRNQVHVYQPQDTELAQQYGEIQWVARIRHAIEQNQFQLYAQKIIGIDSENNNHGLHYEILLQMQLESGRLVKPVTFLPVAERYNLSANLDCWVIEETFKHLVAYPEHLQQLDVCMINLSEQSLHAESFLVFLTQALQTYAVPPTKICFEIGETTAIANLSGATRFINELKTLGYLFALDDFGSGLSSFAYLKNLPVDFLKIDGAFVKDIMADPIDSAMVTAINNIGHVMGRKTIAEFVETEAILSQLKKIGVDYAQGYCIGRPIPLKELILEN